MRSRPYTPAATEGFYAGVYFLLISSDDMCDCVYRFKRNVIFERGGLCEAFWFLLVCGSALQFLHAHIFKLKVAI